jgi:hypothetical protein
MTLAGRALGQLATLLTNCPALPESDRNAPLNWCDGTLDGVLEAGLFQTRAETLSLYQLIATIGCVSAVARAPRSGADIGLSIGTWAHLGVKTSCRPFR